MNALPLKLNEEIDTLIMLQTIIQCNLLSVQLWANNAKMILCYWALQNLENDNNLLFLL